MANALQFPLYLRFSDEDSYGHVNNALYLTFLEDARIQLVNRPLGDAAGEGAAPEATLIDLVGPETFVLVVRHEIEYLLPLNHRVAPVAVNLWVARIGGSSFDMAYTVAEPDGSAVYARATSTLVMASRITGRPVPIGPAVRFAMEHWSGEPLHALRTAKGDS